MSIWNRLNEMDPVARALFLESDDVQKLVIEEHEMRRAYRESLSEAYGTVMICGHEYDAVQALEDVDPVAFNCGFADYTGQDEFCEWSGTYYHADELDDALDAWEAAQEGEG